MRSLTAVHQLLCELFTGQELRRFVRLAEDGSLAAHLPLEDTSLAELAEAVTLIFRRRGGIPELIDRLRENFPRRLTEIDAVMNLWTAEHPSASDEVTTPSPHDAHIHARLEADAYISHNALDKSSVERLCKFLLDVGLRPWFDKWDLAPGGVGNREIDRVLAIVPRIIVCIGEHGWSPWHDAERSTVAHRATSDDRHRVVPILLPGAPAIVEIPAFLREHPVIDLRTESSWSGERARLVATLGFGTRGPWIDERRERPYRGLEPFTEHDAGWMFGREREEAAVLAALRDGQRFITVVGASGSGKSSLVRAGVIPTVRTGGVDGRRRWHAVVMRPGPRPCHELALKLIDLQHSINGTGASIANDNEELERLRTLLLHSEHTLSDTADLLLTHESREERLLLVIDQFEEIFTAYDSRAPSNDLTNTGPRLAREGAALLRNLLHATELDTSRVRVILTVRADFTGECLMVPNLARRMEKMHFALPPMSSVQLRDAIRRPALRVGHDVEKTLGSVRK